MNIKNLLEIAISQRPLLAQAIGYSPDGKNSVEEIPDVISGMYLYASGTPRSINDQSVMDIVPGYRLIHKDELQKEIQTFKDLYSDLHNHIPFLADYSAGYYSVNISTGVIYSVTLEESASEISKSIESFWYTIQAFYEEGVYFLDVDGYLDYNFDLEGKVGARLNPECGYWNE